MIILCKSNTGKVRLIGESPNVGTSMRSSLELECNDPAALRLLQKKVQKGYLYRQPERIVMIYETINKILSPNRLKSYKRLNTYCKIMFNREIPFTFLHKCLFALSTRVVCNDINSAHKFAKSLVEIVGRLSAGHTFQRVIGIKSYGSSGFPKLLLEVKELAYSDNINDKRALDTTIKLLKFLGDNPTIPSPESITDPGEFLNTLPEFQEEDIEPGTYYRLLRDKYPKDRQFFDGLIECDLKAITSLYNYAIDPSRKNESSLPSRDERVKFAKEQMSRYTGLYVSSSNTANGNVVSCQLPDLWLADMTTFADLKTLKDKVLEIVSYTSNHVLKSLIQQNEEILNGPLKFKKPFEDESKPWYGYTDPKFETFKSRLFTRGMGLIQSALKPLQDWNSAILDRLPNDGTRSHNNAFWKIVDGLSSDSICFSADQTKATDRTPKTYQGEFLSIKAPGLYQLWSDVLTGIQYINTTTGELITYNCGQPMGLLTSWNEYAINHIRIGLTAYYMAGGKSLEEYFSKSFFIGDDITNSISYLFHKYYVKIVEYLGVEINPYKGFTPDTCIHRIKGWEGKPPQVFEFCKRIWTSNGEITAPSPIMVDKALTQPQNFLTLISAIRDKRYNLSLTQMTLLTKLCTDEMRAAMLSTSFLLNNEITYDFIKLLNDDNYISDLVFDPDYINIAWNGTLSGDFGLEITSSYLYNIIQRLNMTLNQFKTVMKDIIIREYSQQAKEAVNKMAVFHEVNSRSSIDDIPKDIIDHFTNKSLIDPSSDAFKYSFNAFPYLYVKGVETFGDTVQLGLDRQIYDVNPLQLQKNLELMLDVNTIFKPPKVGKKRISRYEYKNSMVNSVLEKSIYGAFECITDREKLLFHNRKDEYSISDYAAYIAAVVEEHFILLNGNTPSLFGGSSFNLFELLQALKSEVPEDYFNIIASSNCAPYLIPDPDVRDNFKRHLERRRLESTMIPLNDEDKMRTFNYLNLDENSSQSELLAEAISAVCDRCQFGIYQLKEDALQREFPITIPYFSIGIEEYKLNTIKSREFMDLRPAIAALSDLKPDVVG